MTKQETIPEAVASVTYTVQRNGFQMLFTVRGESGTQLLESMDAIEKMLLGKGYTPQEKKVYGGSKPAPEVVPNRKCPTCGSQLITTTLKDGSKAIKCITNKWNPVTKSPEGCKFFERTPETNL